MSETMSEMANLTAAASLFVPSGSSGSESGSSSSSAPTEARRMYNQARGGRRSTKREKREKRGESSSSGSFATVVRVDGSAQARWTHGSGIAVSIDREKKSDGMVGWRTFVSSAPSGGTMVCSLDPNGYGSMNRRSGKTLVCFSGNGSGSLMNVEGRVMKRWDSKGKVTLPDGVTPSWLGLKEGENFLKIKLVEAVVWNGESTEHDWLCNFSATGSRLVVVD